MAIQKSAMSNSAGGDARVCNVQQCWWRCKSLQCPTVLVAMQESPRIIWSNQTTQRPSVFLQNILTLPCPAVATRCSLQSRPRTDWRQLQSVQAPQSTSKQTRGPFTRLRIKLISFFKGVLPPNFNKMVRVWAPGYGSLATRRRTISCACLNVLVPGTNGVKSGGLMDTYGRLLTDIPLQGGK